MHAYIPDGVVLIPSGPLRRMCQKERGTRREVLKLVLEYIKKQELNDIEDGVNIVYCEYMYVCRYVCGLH